MRRIVFAGPNSAGVVVAGVAAAGVVVAGVAAAGVVVVAGVAAAEIAAAEPAGVVYGFGVEVQALHHDKSVMVNLKLVQRRRRQSDVDVVDGSYGKLENGLAGHRHNLGLANESGWGIYAHVFANLNDHRDERALADGGFA